MIRNGVTSKTILVCDCKVAVNPCGEIIPQERAREGDVGTYFAALTQPGRLPGKHIACASGTEKISQVETQKESNAFTNRASLATVFTSIPP
jgi:hypothetical protein